MDNSEAQISSIISHSTSPTLTQRDVENLELEYSSLLEKFPDHLVLLIAYNEFRVSNAEKLPKIRPQILLGGPLIAKYPNLHSFPLLKVADVVCVPRTEDKVPYRSALNCTAWDPFFCVLQKLPPGFSPDFYWDNQVEHHHLVPPGIDTAPFPIVASLCHTYLHKSIEHVCELFDLVIAPSKYYAQVLRKKFPQKVLEMPFGLNWGSFHGMMEPLWEKSIDVSVTFGGTDSLVYMNKRNGVIQMIKDFKAKYGNRFSIELYQNLSKVEYLEVLRKSRITLNVTGIHGPYNYRNMEAMCSGALVFQYDWSDEKFFVNDFSELFKEGIHGVSFNSSNFESKLLEWLENPQKIETMAREAYTYLKENYSYPQLYRDLFKKVSETNVTLPRKQSGFSGYHDVDMVYYYQSNATIQMVCYGVLNDIDYSDWIDLNNIMILAKTIESQYAKNLFMAAIPDLLKKIPRPDLDLLVLHCYYEALSCVPEEQSWIIRWNYLLISLEKETTKPNDITSLIEVLEGIPEASTFDERRLIFKYFVKSDRYPAYQLGSTAQNEYLRLNMDLMKVIDQPLKRAQFYRAYALKALHYFLSCLSG